MDFSIDILKKKLTIMLKSMNAKDIHNFRVAYKHHRALYAVANLQDQTHSQLPPHIKKTYLKAGRIRDLQLEQVKLKRFSGRNKRECTYCLQRIQNRLEKYKIKLRVYYQNHPATESDFNQIAWIEKQITISTIEIFVFNQLSVIEKNQQPAFHTDRKLHQIRKILKNIWYILAYLDQLESGSAQSPFEERYSETSIVPLMNHLGDFQDTCISISVLKEYAKRRKINKQARGFLRYVLRKWKKKKENTRASVSKELLDFPLSQINYLTRATLRLD